MEKIRMGIVGAGVWGRTHASIFQDHPAIEVVAICDKDADRAGKLAEEFQIEDVYSDYEKMARECCCDAGVDRNA